MKAFILAIITGHPHWRSASFYAGQPQLRDNQPQATSVNNPTLMGDAYNLQRAVVTRSWAVPRAPSLSSDDVVHAQNTKFKLAQQPGTPLPQSTAPFWPVALPPVELIRSTNLLLDPLRGANAELRQEQEMLALQLENAKLVHDRVRLSYELEYELRVPANVTKSKVTLAVIEALALGWLGVDHCYMGTIGCGVAKCLTCSGCGFWFIMDFIVISINCLKKLEEIDDVELGFSALFFTDNGEIDTAFWITSINLLLCVLLCAFRFTQGLLIARYFTPWSPLLPGHADVEVGAADSQEPARAADSQEPARACEP